jgi:hypothetical protein
MPDTFDIAVLAFMIITTFAIADLYRRQHRRTERPAAPTAPATPVDPDEWREKQDVFMPRVGDHVILAQYSHFLADDLDAVPGTVGVVKSVESGGEDNDGVHVQWMTEIAQGKGTVRCQPEELLYYQRPR